MAEKDRIRYEIELEKYKEKHKEEIEEDKLRKKENKDKMLRLAEMKKNLLFNKDREKGERMEEEINTNMRNVEVDGKEKLSSVKTP